MCNVALFSLWKIDFLNIYLFVHVCTQIDASPCDSSHVEVKGQTAEIYCVSSRAATEAIRLGAKQYHIL